MGTLSGMSMVLTTCILLYDHFIHRHRFFFVQIKRFLITQPREWGNLGVILVRVCESVFLNLPQSYITWSSKMMTYSYNIT